MYAVGHAIRPNRSSRQATTFRHSGRWALVLVLLFAVSVGLARVAVGESQPDSTIVVEAGDTLWSIAAARYPSDDLRGRVDEIERLNGLQSPLIEVGETLRLPAS